MPFADVFSGFEGAASDHYSKLLEMQYGQRRDAAASIAKMADDPRFDEASSMALKHRALDIIGGDPMKPLSSKDTDISQILVQPPAPLPVKAPGGQGAQNMPIGQQLAGQETPGGPQPQAPPNTGPTGQMAGQTIQAPAPPPHQLGMMPYQQQLERLHGKTVAETKFPPMKVSSVKHMDPDGQVYDYATYAGVNPSTGEYGTWTIKSDQSVAYAPRAAVGAAISGADAARLKEAGIPDTLNQPTLEQEQQIAQMGMRLVHTGYGTFYVASQEYRNVDANGRRLEAPKTPTSGSPLAGAVDVGTAPSGMGTVSNEMRASGVGPDGRIQYTPVTETRQKVPQGGIAAPAPPAPQAAPQGQQQTVDEVPPELRNQISQKILTPELLQFLQTKNPDKTPQQLRQGLMSAGFQDATQGQPLSQAPAPTPPPAQGAQGASAGQGGFNPGTFNTEQGIRRAIIPTMRMMVGTADNPFFDSLETFGKMADDPVASEKVGTAFRAILQGLGNVSSQSGPDVATGLMGTRIGLGGIPQAIGNFMGVNKLIAQSEFTSARQLVAGLSQDEKTWLDRIIAAYGTVVGVRKLTSAGAYQFSTAAMEREIPVPGVVDNSKMYYDRLAQLVGEIHGGMGTLKTADPKEMEFYDRAEKRLTLRSKADFVRKDKAGHQFYAVNGHWYDETGQPVQ